ncbi:MAG: DUF6544 family protein [Halothece sp.]
MHRQQLWETVPPAEIQFRPHQFIALPETAQRYLQSAIAFGKWRSHIAPETPLATAVRLRMHGEIKLKNWCPFTAEQIIRFPEGFIWKARVWMRGLPISGFDRALAGEAAMQWKVLGILPIIRESGADIGRSALGRMQGELMWLPSAFCDASVTWTPFNTSQVQAHVRLQGETTPLTLKVNEQGALETIKFPRWGNPDSKGYRYLNFGGIIEAQRTFQGYTIPTQIRGGWHFDGESFAQAGEFFRATIDEARYR